MSDENNISYIEFPTRDIAATRVFFTSVFGWQFEDYGPEYTSFSGQGVDGGFYLSATVSSSESGAPLVVLYAVALEDVQGRIEDAGGRILKPIFSFPGGRRFHFVEPGGNELAVWSDVDA